VNLALRRSVDTEITGSKLGNGLFVWDALGTISTAFDVDFSRAADKVRDYLRDKGYQAATETVPLVMWTLGKKEGVGTGRASASLFVRLYYVAKDKQGQFYLGKRTLYSKGMTWSDDNYENRMIAPTGNRAIPDEMAIEKTIYMRLKSNLR